VLPLFNEVIFKAAEDRGMFEFGVVYLLTLFDCCKVCCYDGID
jgi:hypothetical protein